jgi:hypothetical protein
VPRCCFFSLVLLKFFCVNNENHQDSFWLYLNILFLSNSASTRIFSALSVIQQFSSTQNYNFSLCATVNFFTVLLPCFIASILPVFRYKLIISTTMVFLLELICLFWMIDLQYVQVQFFFGMHHSFDWKLWYIIIFY